MDIPKSHPRYRSLLARHTLARGIERGLVVPQGLIAQGRGEAFDYLLGEKTTPPARKAEKVAAAYLITAERPVISVNGNVAALAAKEIVKLARIIPAKIEVNLFYRTAARVRRVAEHMMRAGASEVLGIRPDARIPGLEGNRALCSSEGIFPADVVLVPLEDGDRTQALAKMGKTVLAIDLNPMSRTSLASTVAIADELTRALIGITRQVKAMKGHPRKAASIMASFDRDSNLEEVFDYMASRLERMKP